MRQLANLIVPIALVIGLAYMAHGQVELHERLSALDNRLIEVDARRGNPGEPRVVYRTAPTTSGANATTAAPAQLTTPEPEGNRVVEESPDANVAIPPIAEEMTGRGYMYAGDWTDLESQLAAMSVDENKKFWEAMFDALGSGELEVYDE